MAWVLFAVGAENLAKAACVCKGVVKVEDGPSLREYTKEGGFFEGLFKEFPNSGDATRTLTEGYEELRRNRRNRDAHSYHKNERDAYFRCVEKTFVPAFNVLVTVMRQNAPH